MPDRSSGSADLLDAAERLMSERGYAATPVSAVSREAGVAVTSVYHHFGSKEGLLAALMERGADRWFDALPRWDDLAGGPEQRVAAMLDGAADAMARHPAFLRLFYLLALEATDDEAASLIVARVRSRAHDLFRQAIRHVLEGQVPDVADEAAVELAQFAVACSDGCFFAGQLEPARTDLLRLYRDLGTAVRALIPDAVARAREAQQGGRG